MGMGAQKSITVLGRPTRNLVKSHLS